MEMDFLVIFDLMVVHLHLQIYLGSTSPPTQHAMVASLKVLAGNARMIKILSMLVVTVTGWGRVGG